MQPGVWGEAGGLGSPRFLVGRSAHRGQPSDAPVSLSAPLPDLRAFPGRRGSEETFSLAPGVGRSSCQLRGVNPLRNTARPRTQS